MRLLRKKWIGMVGAVIAIALILLTVYVIEKKASIPDIIANPDRYDHEIVFVRGKVVGYQQRTSRFGNEYTVFVLTDRELRIRIYSRGYKKLKEGQEVVIRGLYRKVSRVGRYTFLNEIEAKHIGRWPYIF